MIESVCAHKERSEAVFGNTDITIIPDRKHTPTSVERNMTAIKQLELKEGEWTSLKLSSNKFEYPKVDMKLSFTPEYLHVKATVNDLHFKDGDRSWRYGDGFLINFVTKTFPDAKPSEYFYAYGFSIVSGKRQSILVCHNGVYHLKIFHDFSPEIEIDRARNVAYYNIEIPWSQLKPFHPLLDKTLGINIRYNSQNDDGSTRKLQLVEDDHFESELVAEKRYIPIHLLQSDRSKLQFAFRMENNLVKKDKIQSRIAVFSGSHCEAPLEMILRDKERDVEYKWKKKINIKKGINHFEEILETPDRTAFYEIKLILNNNLKWSHEFYRLSTSELSEIEDYIREYEKKAKTPIEKSSLHGLTFKSDDLKETIKTFDPIEQVIPIKEKLDELRTNVKECETKGHFYQEGYYRTAFKSPDDNTLQPYSIIVPKNFNSKNQYKMIVALHGSGVDEVGFLQLIQRKVENINSNYLFVAPRGRGLSDGYMGQTERDIFVVVDTMKKMFNIAKTIILGFSMGGYGVWRLTFLYPKIFDAAIVGSGCLYNLWGNKPDMDLRSLRHNAKHIPYLVMHGTEDRAAPFEPVKEFVEQIQTEGFNVTFKIFEGAGHGNYNAMKSIHKWLRKYG